MGSSCYGKVELVCNTLSRNEEILSLYTSNATGELLPYTNTPMLVVYSCVL